MKEGDDCGYMRRGGRSFKRRLARFIFKLAIRPLPLRSTPNTIAPNKSPLELIPLEIFQQIRHYLSPDHLSSLLNLMKASRSLYHRILPSLYQHIDFLQNSFCHFLENRQVPTSHLALIRSLDLGGQFVYRTLDALYCSTKRLRHLSIDIGHASDEEIAKFYKYVSCLADLQSLEVNTCPDYLRDAHHFIIPFNFIGTGMEFDLAQVTCPLPKLSKLNISCAHGLDHHTELQSSLTTLIFHLP